MEYKTVKIRDNKNPKHPRVFDVVVDEHGNIQRYELQNIKGFKSVEWVDVCKQIDEAINKTS